MLFLWSVTKVKTQLYSKSLDIYNSVISKGLKISQVKKNKLSLQLYIYFFLQFAYSKNCLIKLCIVRSGTVEVGNYKLVDALPNHSVEPGNHMQNFIFILEISKPWGRTMLSMEYFLFFSIVQGAIFAYPRSD